MSDQEKKQETSISPEPNAEKQSGELSEEELKKVAGGAPTATEKQYYKVTMTNATISG